MIGFYIFEEQPNVGKSLVLAHSALNENIKGYFYVRESDCSDVSSVTKGSTFFGVLDDSSGFGACLFVKDLDTESDALLLQKNLHVKGNVTIDGNSEVQGDQTVKRNVTVNGKLDAMGNVTTHAMITGNSPNTTINLTAAHAALIMAAALSGSAAPLPSVPVIMSNS